MVKKQAHTLVSNASQLTTKASATAYPYNVTSPSSLFPASLELNSTLTSRKWPWRPCQCLPVSAQSRSVKCTATVSLGRDAQETRHSNPDRSPLTGTTHSHQSAVQCVDVASRPAVCSSWNGISPEMLSFGLGIQSICLVVWWLQRFDV